MAQNESEGSGGPKWLQQHGTKMECVDVGSHSQHLEWAWMHPKFWSREGFKTIIPTGRDFDWVQLIHLLAVIKLNKQAGAKNMFLR